MAESRVVYTFLEPWTGDPRLRFCAPLLAVEGADNLVSHRVSPPTGLAAKSAWTSWPRGPLPLGKDWETREMEVSLPSPALTPPHSRRQRMHGHQGPLQDKGQGYPSFPLPLRTD